MNNYFFGNCDYNGTSDLYPRRYRNMVNQQKFTDAAVKIQRWWRKFSLTIVKDRFASWIPY